MRAHTKLRVLVVALLLASRGSQSLANLSGSDDFNDNSRDTSKWFVEAPHLNETNERLEFTSTGSGDEDGIWVWIANEGSQNQSWSTTIDVHNETSPTEAAQFCAMGLFVVNSADDTDVFGIMLASIAYAGRGIMGGWDINGVDYFNLMITTPNSSVALKIDYDAETKELSCAYDTGSGYVTFTNFAVSGWSMSPTDTLRVAIAGWTELSVAVSSGQVYADNFQASTASDISNHVEVVHLSHVHDYGDPTTSADDQFEFEFKTDTDASITNVMLTTPASETLIAGSDGPNDEGIQQWLYNTTGSNLLTNRFGIGDYTVTVTYSNGSQQTTIIPYPTLAEVAMQPTFTSPAPLHGAMFSPTNSSSTNVLMTLQWDEIDPNANIVELHRHQIESGSWEDIGLFTDLVPSADGPLSTRSVGPISFTPGTWGVEHFNGNGALGANADGVFYLARKETLTKYVFTVLEAEGDQDGDDLLNWWEAQYFGGPTNAIASEDSDHDGQSNLEESITGMDPTSAASLFMITNAIPLVDQGHFIIEWPAVPNRIYNASRTTNLMDGFQSLESGISYPRNSYTDEVHSAEDSGFYQVEVELP